MVDFDADSLRKNYWKDKKNHSNAHAKGLCRPLGTLCVKTRRVNGLSRDEARRKKKVRWMGD